jgi:hypothetical protein
MPKTSTSFVPGDPRINRKGRPKKGQSLAEKFRDALTEKSAEDSEDYTKLDMLIDKVVEMALEGDQSAIEFALARGWGKLIDRIEITPKQEYDLSKLSDEEIDQLEGIHKKLAQKDMNAIDG